jgi:opacity protein-like surface antigen
MRLTSLAIALLLLPSFASTQAVRDRARTWEVGLQVVDTSSETLSGEEGSGLSVGSSTGWGISGGYNFTNRLAVLADWTWSKPSYDATFLVEDTGELETLSHSLNINTLQVKGVFYFTEGALAPFVEAGLGWTYIDSNVIDGPPTTGCWWDPWWGYICRDFFSTYSDTRTSYSTAVGLRWDLRNGMTLRGSYGLLEVDTSSSTEDASMDAIKLDLLWRF